MENKKFSKTENFALCAACAAVCFSIKIGADDVCPCIT